MTKRDRFSTVSSEEIAKFELMAEDWWNPLGKFKPLHDLTPLRLEYIISLIKNNYHINSLGGVAILDIGCGGGVVTEPLARLKSDIMGIDASSVNIKIAKDHAKLSNLKINYQNISAEDLLKKNKKQFQVILALEIIEHVENIDLFLESCCNLLQEGGILILSTMNKTLKSFIESIIVAEYLLQWLPVGTHNWSKFIKPSQIADHIKKYNMKLVDIKGISYSILSQNWYLSDNIKNNYFISFVKLP